MTWEIVGSTLITIASSHDTKLRVYACQAMERLVTLALSASPGGPKRELMRKFTELIRSPHADTKESALQALYRIVSAVGPHLEGLWTLVVAELLIVSTGPNKVGSYWNIILLLVTCSNSHSPKALAPVGVQSGPVDHGRLQTEP